MNILWAGGEDISFVDSGLVTVDTSVGYFRSGYARCALKTNQSPYSKSLTFLGGAVTDFWLHFYLHANGNTAPYGSHRICGVGKAETDCGLWISNGDNGSDLRLLKYDGTTSTTLATTEEAGIVVTGSYDMHVAQFGENATVDVYVNNVPQIHYEGDVTLTGMDDVDIVVLEGFDQYEFFSHHFYCSEMFVADADTRTKSLVTFAPNAAGDTNEWDGDGYGGIDEISLSDADLVYTDTGDEDFQCNLTATPTGQFGVIGIVEAVRACKSNDAAIQGLKIGVKSNGTVDVDAGRDLTTAWHTYERIAHTINGSQLTTALLDALQIDLRSAASASTSTSASASSTPSASASAS